MYSDIKREAEPLVRASKLASKAFLPLTNKLLPNRLASRFSKFVEGGDDNDREWSSGESGEGDNSDSEVADVLRNVFGAENAQTTAQHNENLANTVIDRNITKKHFQHNSQQLDIQNELLSRIVGYQDSILSAFQKKSLELQYRQYYNTKKLLEVTATTSKIKIEALAGIVKNTSLANESKVTDAEMIRNKTKSLLIGRTQDFTRNRLGNFTNNLKKTVVKQVREYSNDLTSQLDMLEMMKSMSSGMSPAEIEEFLMPGIGQELAGGLGEKLGKTHGKKLLNFAMGKYPIFGDKLVKYSHVLDRLRNEYPARLRNYIQDSNNPIAEAISRAMSLGNENTETVTRNLRYNATEKVEYDLLSRKSVTEIIPGYLSMTLQKVSDIYNVLSGSTEKSDKIVFSATTENFVTTKQRDREVERSFKQKITSTVKSEVDNIIKQIDPDGDKLTKQERIKLGVYLTQQAYAQRLFDPEEYADPANLPSDIAYSVAPLFAEAFGLEEDEIDIRGRQRYKMADTEEVADRYKEIANSFTHLGSGVSGTQDLINELNQVNDIDTLRRLGAVNDSGYTQDYMWKLVEEYLSTENMSDFLNPKSDKENLSLIHI